MRSSSTRRELLGTALAAVPALATEGAEPPQAGPGLGVVIHSFPNHVAADRDRPAAERFDDAFRFLESCRPLGVDVIQVGLGRRPEAEAERLRTTAEQAGIALEGIARLPREAAEAERFEAELRTARLAGATIVRTVLLEGRRYETFDSDAAFQRFAAAAHATLARALPIAARTGITLAVENHKDWRADELIALIQRHESEHLGVCLDTGNSIALLEDPMAVVEALAPWAVTTHFKDMGVQETDDGFLLAEVPFGEGFLDLGRIVRTVRAARPQTRFVVEMITRDPLSIPCLTEKYWATFGSLCGVHLARALRMVRRHAAPNPLPRISQLERAERLRVESENVRRCLAFARTRLGLA